MQLYNDRCNVTDIVVFISIRNFVSHSSYIIIYINSLLCDSSD